MRSSADGHGHHRRSKPKPPAVHLDGKSRLVDCEVVPRRELDSKTVHGFNRDRITRIAHRPDQRVTPWSGARVLTPPVWALDIPDLPRFHKVLVRQRLPSTLLHPLLSDIISHGAAG